MPPEKRKQFKIPQWATLSSSVQTQTITGQSGRRQRQRQQQKHVDAMDLLEEERILRTRIYHHWSRLIDQTVWQAMQRHSVDDYLQELDDLKSKTSPLVPFMAQNDGNPPYPSAATINNQLSIHNGQDDSIPCSSEDDGIGSLAERYTVKLSRTFNHQMLPVLSIQGPFFKLDQLEWMKQLVAATRSTSSRSATIWLQSSSNSSKTIGVTHHIKDLVEQCWQQKDVDTMPSSVKRRKKMSNWTDLLVEWASHVTQFDDIILFMEVTSSETEVGDLINWLADRRANHGVPIICVMLRGCQSCTNIPSSSHGPAGLFVQTFQLASSTAILNDFWQRLVQRENFPWYLLPLNVLEQLLVNFEIHLSSFVQTVLDLKKAVSFVFSEPKSFILWSLSASLPNADRMRIMWFCIDSQGRQQIFGHRFNQKSELQNWLQMTTIQHHQCLIAHKLLCKLQTSFGFAEPNMFASLRGTSNKFMLLSKDIQKEIIDELFAMRNQYSKSDAKADTLKNDDLFFIENSVDHCNDLIKQHVRARTNELIVLVANCTSLLELYRCINLLVESSIENISQLMSLSSLPESCQAALSANIRQQTAAELLENTSLDASRISNTKNESYILRLLYQNMKDRLDVSLKECCDSIEQLGFTGDTVLLHVACSVNALKIQGLASVKRATTKSEDVVFEKDAVVWCNGD